MGPHLPARTLACDGAEANLRPGRLGLDQNNPVRLHS